MLQETLLAAWRGLGQYEGRAVAAHLAVPDRDQPLPERAARQRPPAAAGTARAAVPEPTEPTRRGEPLWLEPYPDALLDGLPDAARSRTRYEAKETIALAFVAAVQHLPPRQRAVLLLRDALGFRAAEVADMLDSSEASVNSALQRARATMTARLPGPGPGTRAAAPLGPGARARERFAAAYADDDVDGVVALLTDDAWFTHAAGHAGVPGPRGHRRLPGATARATAAAARYRLVPTRANGQPAFGCYVPDEHAPVFRAHGILVLTLQGDRISAITRFVDSSTGPVRPAADAGRLASICGRAGRSGRRRRRRSRSPASRTYLGTIVPLAATQLLLSLASRWPLRVWKVGPRDGLESPVGLARAWSGACVGWPWRRAEGSWLW